MDIFLLSFLMHVGIPGAGFCVPPPCVDGYRGTFVDGTSICCPIVENEFVLHPTIGKNQKFSIQFARGRPWCNSSKIQRQLYKIAVECYYRWVFESIMKGNDPGSEVLRITAIIPLSLLPAGPVAMLKTGANKAPEDILTCIIKNQIETTGIVSDETCGAFIIYFAELNYSTTTRPQPSRLLSASNCTEGNTDSVHK
jgi:hypothetical protein